MNADPEDVASPERQIDTPAKNGRTSVSRRGEPTKAPSENGHEPKPVRITVEGQGVRAADDALPLAVAELGPRRQLVVPSSADLHVALAQANTLEELVNFDKMIAVLKAAGEQFRVAIDESIRVATVDLATRRKIGAILLQVERRGGDRAKWHDATLLDELLQDIGKDKAKRCRTIARIEGPDFADYMKEMTEEREVPNEAGLKRHAARVTWARSGMRPTRRNERKSTRQTDGALVISQAIIDCVRRVLGDIDVCIGDADVKCRLRLRPSTAQAKQLRGNVFVSDCPEPVEWLPRLVRLRSNATLDQVVVALHAETAARWFRILAATEWSLCFIVAVQPPLLLAHLGHHHAFDLAVREHGTVLRPQ